MIFKKPIYFSLFFVLCLFNICVHAQTVEVKTDRSQVLIGERIQYDLLITAPSQGFSINFTLPDSIPHFETIENGDYDTVTNNGAVTLRRKIVFTSFDSGAWYIPSMPITIAVNNDSRRIMTDSVLINVGYSPADSTGELRDIKPIMEVTVKDYFWYYVAGAVLTAVIIFFLIYSYFKNRKRKPVPVLHSDLSPFDEAMKDIVALSKYNLANAAESKEYHTQISFILKRYYSRTIETNLLNKTTGDLLLKMKEQEQPMAEVTSVAEILRIGDAVKFAKYIPPVSESEQVAKSLKAVIEKMENNKPSKINKASS